MTHTVPKSRMTNTIASKLTASSHAIAASHPLPRSFGLDLARSVAISLVILSHFVHNRLDFIGFWGVELFFALSGFLIGQILWRNFSRTREWTWPHITNFWSRRWWRTLPNYYLFFLLLLAFDYWGQGHVPPVSELSSFVWFGQYLLSHGFGFYAQSWSLCIEEWFYLTFPIILFGFSKLNLKPRVSFVSTLLVFFIGAGIVRLILLGYNNPLNLREITFARLDAIACGVAITYIHSFARSSFKLKLICFFFGAVLLVISMSILHYIADTNALKSWTLLIVPLGFASMLPLISIWPAPNGRLTTITLSIEKISLWSYSIYLSHVPIMWIVYHVMSAQRGNFYGNLFSKIIGLIATLIISALLYNYFEMPFTKMRPREL